MELVRTRFHGSIHIPHCETGRPSRLQKSCIWQTGVIRIFKPVQLARVMRRCSRPGTCKTCSGTCTPRYPCTSTAPVATGASAFVARDAHAPPLALRLALLALLALAEVVAPASARPPDPRPAPTSARGTRRRRSARWCARQPSPRAKSPARRAPRRKRINCTRYTAVKDAAPDTPESEAEGAVTGAVDRAKENLS
jgi:hypothetical protein